jgi:hypothetical protein
MNIAELEEEVENYVDQSGDVSALKSLIVSDELRVVKYIPAEYLANTLARGQLYASERAGFTWGDAIYVSPVAMPLTTMMYGEVGVVGTYPTEGTRFFDAINPVGLGLYQQWITTQTVPYRDLTTTVHANEANKELRNAFRSRFQIDCVYFRPDEDCQDYVDVTRDWWLAVTHWDAHRGIGHGYSGAITGLRWCVVVPDAFKAQGRGYKASLYKGLASSHVWTVGHYSTLVADIGRAYSANQGEVVVCDFG